MNKQNQKKEISRLLQEAVFENTGKVTLYFL